MIGGHWHVNGSTVMGTKIVRSWFCIVYEFKVAKPRVDYANQDLTNICVQETGVKSFVVMKKLYYSTIMA